MCVPNVNTVFHVTLVPHHYYIKNMYSPLVPQLHESHIGKLGGP